MNGLNWQSRLENYWINRYSVTNTFARYLWAELVLVYFLNQILCFPLWSILVVIKLLIQLITSNNDGICSHYFSKRPHHYFSIIISNWVGCWRAIDVSVEVLFFIITFKRMVRNNYYSYLGFSINVISQSGRQIFDKFTVGNTELPSYCITVHDKLRTNQFSIIRACSRCWFNSYHLNRWNLLIWISLFWFLSI